MSLEPGGRVGPYEIMAPLGAGGMGEVYRARDPRIGRDVAIKILPAAFSQDPERLARLRREAQVLGSLNHPHIAAIYGFEETSGVSALVLELVEGPTLADRIARGPIPLDEALPIARQIAEALEAAHEQNIIHRDLKPANIKLKPDGTVKVLDFGLAKALQASDSELQASGVSQLPTITSPALTTDAGVILGTAAYMSPEQAKGNPVDRRTDVWAFGCVLYEILTGARPFGGQDVTDSLAAILKSEPDWSALPGSTPSSIVRLLRRCLAKDRQARLSDAAVARLEIEDARIPEPAPNSGAGSTSRGRLFALASIVIAAALLGALGVQYVRPAREELATIRYSAHPEEGTVWAPTAAPGEPSNSVLAVSPDGRRIAFTARTVAGTSLLWIRAIDAVSAQPLPGTDGAASPFWSPDSRYLGFFADGKLKRIDTSGGPATTVCDAVNNRGASWGDGTIVFAAGGGVLKKVPEGGGVPNAATALGNGERSHGNPHFLPDGRRFLYAANKGPEQISTDLYAGSLDSAARTFVTKLDIATLQYAHEHVLFVRDTTLMAQPFDTRSLQLSGEPVPVAEGVQISAGAVPFFAVFSVSLNGVLAYLTGGRTNHSSLVWFDRNGTRLEVLSESGQYADIELSSDGRVAVSEITADNTTDISVFDPKRKVPTKLVYHPSTDHAMVWSSAGTSLVFASTRKGNFDLYQKPATATGTEELLIEGPLNSFPTSWSRDDRFILYQESAPDTRGDLWLLSMEDKKPTPFLRTPFNEAEGRFSPDMRWVAYRSNLSGRSEIYVSSFPAATAMERISTNGGAWPRWSSDGKEIFFLSSDNVLMAAAVDGTGAAFKVGAVTTLFAPPLKNASVRFYDVSPDGQRFLINAANQDRSASLMTVVVNWATALRLRK